MRTKKEILTDTEFRNEGEAERVLIEVLVDIRDQLAFFNNNVIRPEEFGRRGAVRTSNS